MIDATPTLGSSSPPFHKEKLILRLVLTLAATLAALSICLGLPMAAYAGIALVSAIVFHLSLRPSWYEMLATLVPSILFWAAYVFLFKIPPHLMPRPIFVLGTLGAGSLATLSVRAVWSEGKERERVLSVLFPAVGLLVFLTLKQNLINVMALQPGTYDVYLFFTDATLGFHPSVLLRNFFLAHHHWYPVIAIIYSSLSVAMAVVYAAHLHKCKSKYYMLQLFLAAGFLGWLAYNIVPAAGPAYFFGWNFIGPVPAYHELPHLALDKVPLPATVFRNAMPSLHMTWALLMYWNSRRLGSWVHWFAAIFAFLTAIATLGTGEHYLVDLVVAFPFSLFIQGLSSRPLKDSRMRTNAMILGIVLSLAWMLVIRLDPRVFLVSRALPWTAMLITVIGVQIVFVRFERAASGVFWSQSKVSIVNDELIPSQTQTFVGRN